MKFIPFFLLTMASLPLIAQPSKSLHQGAILVDTHNDFPSASIEKKLSLDHALKGKTHSDLARLQEGGVDIQLFSIFCGGEQAKPYAWANREIDSVYEWAQRNPKRMMMVYDSKELGVAVKKHKLGAMLGMEGGHMIEDNLDKLDSLYKRGVRYMTLTWNNSPSWATSALDETTNQHLPHKGLTDFGKKVVQRMNELGMIVDLSHTGEQTFWDAIATSQKPVIASHSSVFQLCPHRRNLKDDQIRAIGKNGGVIHLNFYAGFIDSNYERRSSAFMAAHQPEIDSLVASGTQSDYARFMVAEKYTGDVNGLRPSIELLMDHLDYIVRMIGVDHVGLGSDFDGIEAPPRELNGVEDFPLVTEAMLKRGYSPKDIRKILGENFIRVLKANEAALPVHH